jgi:3-methyl-2-oxobutanoate hydroxymethyltransferase
MGGHRVQGQREGSGPGCRQRLIDDARAIEQAGAFAIVLEGIPAPLAREITAMLAVPTIGIGAGADCDGQVLVMHDMLGLSSGFVPRFAKPYASLWQDASAATLAYLREVREHAFPGAEHSYGLKGKR